MKSKGFVLKDRSYKTADFLAIPFQAAPAHAVSILADTVIKAFLPSLQVLVTARFVDTAIGIFNGKSDSHAIYTPLILLMAIIAYQYIDSAIIGILQTRLELRLNEQFRVALVEKRAKLAYRHVEDNDVWELINRVCKDPANRIYQGGMVVLNMISMIIGVVSILAILVVQIWWIAFVVTAVSVPLFMLAVKSGKSEYEASKEAAKHQRKAKYLQGILTGRDNVEERTMFSYSSSLNTKWYGLYEKARKINLKMQARNFAKMKGASIITLFISLLISGILLSPLSSGAITIGMFMGLVTGTFNLVQLMSWQLSYVTKELANNREYLADLTKFAGLSETPGALDLPDTTARRAEFESVEFINVSFVYPGTQKYILKNLSMKLDAKKHYAFVGVNGAGKTTITKILTGLYDGFEGEILINERSIREYTSAELKGFFSVVYQDFAKYSIRFKDNAALGDLSRESGEAAARAIETIGLSETVEKLPHGADTWLGKIKEGGVDLSGGEWQRLAIARALVGNAPVYILDEPTAALDPSAESKIYEMFGEISTGRSTIFITHRLGAARLADEILVIDGGAVSEKGSHETLMDLGGLYAGMFESQRSWYN